jgi:hypothetical protein
MFDYDANETFLGHAKQISFCPFQCPTLENLLWFIVQTLVVSRIDL